MSKIEKAIITLNDLQNGLEMTGRDPRAVTLVAIVYLVVLLSVPLTSLPTVIWLGIYPIIAGQIMTGGYRRIIVQSLYVLPFIILIGVFNPLYDRNEAFRIAGISVSEGWLTFLSVVFRGLWAVQTVLILIQAIGFFGFCRGLRGLGVPKFLTVQLLMIYRYLSVLLEEALRMKRARESRGYGKKSMSLKIWGPMIGQLFVRTVDKAGKIHSAMMSRGFTGEMPYSRSYTRWNAKDTIFVLGWCVVFIVLRLVHPEKVF